MRLPGPLRSPALLALVAANVLPLVGVLALGWDLAEVLLLYWAESLVIGLFTVVRLVRGAGAAAFFLVPFFCVHFGTFMSVHLMFLVALFGVGRGGGPGWLALPLLALGLAHGTQFVQTDLRNPPTDPKRAMIAPYPRVIVLHLTLLAGSFLVLFLGAPAAALGLLVVLKTGVDVARFVRERRKAGASTTEAQPA